MWVCGMLVNNSSLTIMTSMNRKVRHIRVSNGFEIFPHNIFMATNKFRSTNSNRSIMNWKPQRTCRTSFSILSCSSIIILQYKYTASFGHPLWADRWFSLEDHSSLLIAPLHLGTPDTPVLNLVYRWRSVIINYCFLKGLDEWYRSEILWGYRGPWWGLAVKFWDRVSHAIMPIWCACR